MLQYTLLDPALEGSICNMALEFFDLNILQYKAAQIPPVNYTIESTACSREDTVEGSTASSVHIYLHHLPVALNREYTLDTDRI